MLTSLALSLFFISRNTEIKCGWMIFYKCITIKFLCTCICIMAITHWFSHHSNVFFLTINSSYLSTSLTKSHYIVLDTWLTLSKLFYPCVLHIGNEILCILLHHLKTLENHTRLSLLLLLFLIISTIQDHLSCILSNTLIETYTQYWLYWIHSSFAYCQKFYT